MVLGRAFHLSAVHAEGSLSKVKETLLCSTDCKTENRMYLFGKRVRSDLTPICENDQAGTFRALHRAGVFQLLVLTKY